MQDITELERRIAAAFDRIDRGLEQADRARATVIPLPADKVPTDTSGALLRSLETAQASSADWAKRYAALEAQLAEVTLSMAGDIAKLNQALATTTDALQAALAVPPAEQPLQSAQELQVLDEQMAALRRQLAVQETELTQLRTQRAAEIEELKSIVAALTPLIEEAQSNA